MKSNDYVSGLMLRLRLDAVEKRVTEPKRNLAEIAAEKLEQDRPITRKELAAWLGVSTRKIQRMEAAGTIRRCPNLGTVVRYAARDVLRLARAA